LFTQVMQDDAMPIELPPDYDEFKAEVISDQAEDDQGVYEVWWSANARYAHLPLSSRLAIAEVVVTDLLRERRIALVRGDFAGRRLRRQAVQDQEAVLREWATWVPQAGEPVVWMTTP
jgi:hypothetical protein